MDDAATGPEGEHEVDPIHVVERGDSWEVWRRGDSMPLGTYVTRGEADEQATAAAAALGTSPVHDDL